MTVVEGSCCLVPKFPFGNVLDCKSSAARVHGSSYLSDGNFPLAETEFLAQARSEMEILERGGTALGTFPKIDFVAENLLEGLAFAD